MSTGSSAESLFNFPTLLLPVFKKLAHEKLNVANAAGVSEHRLCFSCLALCHSHNLLNISYNWIKEGQRLEPG